MLGDGPPRKTIPDDVWFQWRGLSDQEALVLCIVCEQFYGKNARSLYSPRAGGPDWQGQVSSSPVAKFARSRLSRV